MLRNEDNDEAESAKTVPTNESTIEATVDPRDVRIVVLDDQSDVWLDYREKKKDGSELPPHFGTLDNAIEHILAAHEADGTRSDRRIDDLNKWRFALSPDGNGCMFKPNSDDVLYPRFTAFAQLAARAKAPGGYLRSIPARYSVPALNWGIENKAEGPATLRLAGDDEVRAVLSKRYALFDDAIVLPIIRVVLAGAGLIDTARARVVATGLTTMLRLSVDGETLSIPGTQEVAEIAIDITNGEVGNRSLSLAPSVYITQKVGQRAFSTRRTTLRLRHLGSPAKLEGEFREKLPEAIDHARTLRLQVIAAVDKAVADVATEAEKLQNLGLTLAEARDVCRHLASNAGMKLPVDTAEWEGPLATLTDVRAYDVFAAIASLGDDKGIDRRLELEEAAAKYLARAAK